MNVLVAVKRMMESRFQEPELETFHGIRVDEIIHIDPAFSDTVAFCERYGYPLDHTCNTIIVTSRKGVKKYAACVVLAHTRLDVNKRVRGLLKVPKVSFATPEEAAELTDMKLGGISPFGLPTDWPLYIDERVMACGWVIVGSGSREIKLRIAPGVFAELQAEIVSGLAIPI